MSDVFYVINNGDDFQEWIGSDYVNSKVQIAPFKIDNEFYFDTRAIANEFNFIHQDFLAYIASYCDEPNIKNASYLLVNIRLISLVFIYQRLKRGQNV